MEIHGVLKKFFWCVRGPDVEIRNDTFKLLECFFPILLMNNVVKVCRRL